MTKRFPSPPLDFVLLLALGLLMGCGKSEYEELMQAKLRQLNFASVFVDNLYAQPTDISDFARIRLPLFLDETATPHAPGAVSEMRLQPPFVKLPGFQFCYEASYHLGGTEQHPFYCYFAVTPTSEKNQATLLAELRRDIGGKFQGATWQDVELDTPDGGKIDWKKMSVRGPQMFDLAVANDEPRQINGQFDLYVHSTPAFHFLVGFRATEQVAQQIDLFNKVPYSLGTLEVNSEAAAADAS